MVVISPFFLVGYKSVPGGGYLTHLGRTPANHRKVLRQLVLKRWFANSTRFLFVDFVGYNPNTNLFNVVCLMMEISMTGDIMKHYTVCGTLTHDLRRLIGR